MNFAPVEHCCCLTNEQKSVFTLGINRDYEEIDIRGENYDEKAFTFYRCLPRFDSTSDDIWKDFALFRQVIDVISALVEVQYTSVCFTSVLNVFKKSAKRIVNVVSVSALSREEVETLDVLTVNCL